VLGQIPRADAVLNTCIWSYRLAGRLGDQMLRQWTIVNPVGAWPPADLICGERGLILRRPSDWRPNFSTLRLRRSSTTIA
jgi:hypothetical protein